jgi:hypothetical protein
MRIELTITEDSASIVVISHDADSPTLFADLLADYQYDSRSGRRFEWPHTFLADWFCKVCRTHKSAMHGNPDSGLCADCYDA